jgi:hypothetical protein
MGYPRAVDVVVTGARVRPHDQEVGAIERHRWSGLVHRLKRYRYPGRIKQDPIARQPRAEYVVLETASVVGPDQEVVVAVEGDPRVTLGLRARCVDGIGVEQERGRIELQVTRHLPDDLGWVERQHRVALRSRHRQAQGQNSKQAQTHGFLPFAAF